PCPVECLAAHAAKVANAGKTEGDEAIEELPHAVATQGHATTDGHSLTQLEACDRLLRSSHHGLLAGDGRELRDCRVHDLGVGDRIAETHVHHDLLDAGSLKLVLVSEPLHQLGMNRLLVELLHAGSSCLRL